MSGMQAVGPVAAGERVEVCGESWGLSLDR